jgi:hypothetical protein
MLVAGVGEHHKELAVGGKILYSQVVVRCIDSEVVLAHTEREAVGPIVQLKAVDHTAVVVEHRRFVAVVDHTLLEGVVDRQSCFVEGEAHRSLVVQVVHPIHLVAAAWEAIGRSYYRRTEVVEVADCCTRT